MTTTLTELPIVDMSLLDGDNAGRARFRPRTAGSDTRGRFFYLVGHGIDRATRERLFATVRAFFAPPEVTVRRRNVQSPHFRGYTRFGGESTPRRDRLA